MATFTSALRVRARPAGDRRAPLPLRAARAGAGRHDVRVVAAGDRGEGAGLGDAGGFEDLPVEAEAEHRPPAPAIREVALEPPALLVDDRDGVAGAIETDREFSTQPPAPDHDD